MTIRKNTLCLGDNLMFLRNGSLFPDECVDLIYADPPLNPHRGHQSASAEIESSPTESQIHVPEGIWRWNDDAAARYQDVLASAPERLRAILSSLHTLLGQSAMFAYLVHMTPRLSEMHRVLRKTGSLFLHCDPIASHYLKIVLDAIFGPRALVNEIVWKRVTAHGDVTRGSTNMGRIHDIILFFRKSDKGTFNVQYAKYSQEYLNHFYPFVDKLTGKRYRLADLTTVRSGSDSFYQWRVKRQGQDDFVADLTDEYKTPKPGWEYKTVLPYKNRYWACTCEKMAQMERDNLLVYSRTGFPRFKRFLVERGLPVQDIWLDIAPIIGTEKLFPTQKPVALLERIISMASNPGDVILDPFCGGGSAVEAVENINRSLPPKKERIWVGLDSTHLSMSIIKHRLLQYANPPASYNVIGEPKDERAAMSLAQRDRFQFQCWAFGLVGARPWGGERRNRPDRPIDGVRLFNDEKSGGKPKALLVQVSDKNIKIEDIRALRSALGRTKARMGLLIGLQRPTKDALTEAIASGPYFCASNQQAYPRIQVVTVEELLADTGSRNGSPSCLDLPPNYASQIPVAAAQSVE